MKPFGLLLTVLFSTLVLGFGTPQSLWAQANLENPEDRSYQSGIGVISGWKCTANRIDIVVDDRVTVQAPYGTLRGDTQAVYGDANNGFGYLVNWNNLGDGQHTLRVLADGVEFAHVTFTVVTLGQDFLRGASRTKPLGFAGCQVALQWQESLQNFAIVDERACFQSLHGRWEFVTMTPAGQRRDHYLLPEFITDESLEIDAILGTDLDDNGPAAIFHVVDLLAIPFPYAFELVTVSGSSCEAFFFNQTNANTVTGVGIFSVPDATGKCLVPSATSGLTLSSMTGTKTGVALSRLQSDGSAAPEQPQIRAQVGAEARQRALQVLQSIK